MTRLRRFLLSIALAPALTGAAADVHESVERIGSAGVTERALLIQTDESVRDVLLVFSGGDGYLGLRDTPPSTSAFARSSPDSKPNCAQPDHPRERPIPWERAQVHRFVPAVRRWR